MKKVCAIILAMVMVLTMIPAAAFAVVEEMGDYPAYQQVDAEQDEQFP